jgi:serine/threonine protein kinase
MPPLSAVPAPGSVIAGRFIIEHQAGRGGMGAVFRARDTLGGQTVALKLMHPTVDAERARRFAREAELLAGLSHPGIVTHVAHGLSEDGQPFLAMEWLEGEDLAHRLVRQPLSLSESLLLLRRIAEALAVAHRRGIVHRDLKPSNLFLRQGQLEEVVVLDFGLARYLLASESMTGSATVLGTPAYMAPEQASCQEELASSADIFSLGCVLYECLTGQQPFRAPHVAAVLAKILFAEPPPLLSLRGDLPPSLQGLVDRMLAKDPKRRPRDAMELLETLSGLKVFEDAGAPAERESPRELAGVEQQLVSILLVRLQPAGGSEEMQREQLLAASTALSPREALLEHLRSTFSSHGAQVVLLADGSLLITLLPERGTATDQAALAARCALSIKEHWPEASIVLATGRGILGRQQPVGEVMERAGQLLRQCERVPADTSAQVLLDEVTAGLLNPAFQLDPLASGAFRLQGEHLDVDKSRLLLGQPTPCVGREQELSMLELAYGTCVADATAHALLVMAPAGMGKSRLRHEFLRRLEKQGREVLLLLGKGDSMRAGTAYGQLGQAVRRLCGIQDGEALEARREKLQRRVGQHLPEGTARDVIAFLGELCAISFPDEDNPRLRAARTDPRLMNTQVGRAFVAFLEAELARRPVLLVLEDLHWGDELTVQVVDEALRALSERPLMVLALARPEVRELFPGLWGQQLQELTLRGLSRKAGIRLVREVLGPDVSEATVERVVEQAAGNALFLEELIRMVSEGHGEAPPATVLAMLQTRIQRLEAGARRVLLAASFFGRNFWVGGLKSLLGTADLGAPLEQWLRQLVELEVVEQQPESRFPSEMEFRFRHSLVRDATYGLVPDSYRPTGHRLTGAWLEQMEEPDALVVAEHYKRGQEHERAVVFFLRAAEQLAERDWQAALRCVEAGKACGASGAMLTQLRAVQAAIGMYRQHDYLQQYEMGSSVLSELKPGSIVWCRLISPTATNAFFSGKIEEGGRLSQLLLRTDPEPAAISAYVDALYLPLVSCVLVGARQRASAVLQRMEAVGATIVERDAFTRGCLRLAQSLFGLYFEQPWQAFLLGQQGLRIFRELGLERQLILAQTSAARALAQLGDVPGSMEMLQDVLRATERLGMSSHVPHSKTHLAMVLAWSPQASHQAAARELALDVMKDTMSNPLTIGRVHTVLAKVAAWQGMPHESESQARRACELLGPFLPYKSLARSVLCTSLLSQGRAAEAREVAGLGVQEVEQLGGGGFSAIGAYLARAEACFAGSDDEAGESALRQALSGVRARAGDIAELPLRERFLHSVPEHARVLELARLRWGEVR